MKNNIHVCYRNFLTGQIQLENYRKLKHSIMQPDPTDDFLALFKCVSVYMEDASLHWAQIVPLRHQIKHQHCM